MTPVEPPKKAIGRNTADSTGQSPPARRRFRPSIFGGFASGEPFVAHNALDVLHHHDGVIHQQADRQHHGEQRQGVNRVAEQGQHPEGAKQHHRHRYRRNERRAEVLQEQVHHADDEDNRFEQGLNHVLDRDFDELGAVLRIGNIVTLRHLTLEFGDFAFHQRRGVQRVGAGAIITAIPAAGWPFRLAVAV